MTVTEFIVALEIGLIYGLVAIGIFLTFKVIDYPDLTCDGSFTLGSAASSILIKSGCNPWISLILATIAGAAAGLSTGLLSTKLKVTDLLAGILVGFMLYSVNLHVMGGAPNIALNEFDTIFGNKNVLITLAIFVSVVAFLVGYMLLTDFGLSLRAIGLNKCLAKSCGVNLQTMTIIGLSLSNGLVALAGGLFSQYQGFADISAGMGTVIAGLAAVMIGEQLFPFRSQIIKIISCILGSSVYKIVTGLALHVDFIKLESWDINIIAGLMVIMVVFLSRRRPC